MLLPFVSQTDKISSIWKLYWVVLALTKLLIMSFLSAAEAFLQILELYVLACENVTFSYHVLGSPGRTDQQ